MTIFVVIRMRNIIYYGFQLDAFYLAHNAANQPRGLLRRLNLPGVRPARA